MEKYFLTPEFGNMISYYGTAVIIEISSTEKMLKCIGKKVCTISGITAHVTDDYLTDLEIIQVRDFLLQNNFEVGGLSPEELKERYGNPLRIHQRYQKDKCVPWEKEERDNTLRYTDDAEYNEWFAAKKLAKEE